MSKKFLNTDYFNAPLKHWLVALRSYLDLGLHLEANAELVSRLVKLGAVQVGGKGDGAAIPDLLLVTQANLEKEMFSTESWKK